LKLERVVFEGLEVTNRWILLRGIRETVDDLRKGIVHRVKSKLGAAQSGDASHDEVSAGSSAAGKIPADMIIHIPAPVAGLDSKW
jgi:hypothetical protein